jgi:hypothetical protein
LHHWEHGEIPNLKRKRLSFWLRLQLRRILQLTSIMHNEGCPIWEMSYVLNLAKLDQLRIESRRPRLYDYRGLRRLDTAPDLAVPSLV